jgi:hypothetical protein
MVEVDRKQLEKDGVRLVNARVWIIRHLAYLCIFVSPDIFIHLCRFIVSGDEE